jgi:DnaJ-class molecular chaperone
METEPKFYLETRQHCEDCNGVGYSHFSKTVHVRRRCPKCDGYGYVKDQIEVKLASVGDGTFVISGRWVKE